MDVVEWEAWGLGNPKLVRDYLRVMAAGVHPPPSGLILGQEDLFWRVWVPFPHSMTLFFVVQNFGGFDSNFG